MITKLASMEEGVRRCEAEDHRPPRSGFPGRGFFLHECSGCGERTVMAVNEDGSILARHRQGGHEWRVHVSTESAEAAENREAYRNG